MSALFLSAGMDVGNIVEGGRRRGAPRPALNYAAMTAADSDGSEQSDSAAEEVRVPGCGGAPG